MTRLVLLIAWYACASLAAFTAFAWDKHRARSGGWRTSERTLHLVTVAGGWPGTLLAMQILRHKNRKPFFWFVAGFAAAIHGSFWLWILLR